jgi:hypothetical protein
MKGEDSEYKEKALYDLLLSWGGRLQALRLRLNRFSLPSLVATRHDADDFGGRSQTSVSTSSRFALVFKTRGAEEVIGRLTVNFGDLQEDSNEVEKTAITLRLYTRLERKAHIFTMSFILGGRKGSATPCHVA